MNTLTIQILYDAAPLKSAIDQLGEFGARVVLKFDVDFPTEFRKIFRQIFVERFFDSAKLIRADSAPTADGAGDVLVSFHPSDLFLQLLAALRASNLDVDKAEAA